MLLINPCYSWWWTSPALGLGWIASSLERIGISPKIIDCQVTPGYKKLILDYLENGYSTVGITVNSSTISSAIDIASLIRQNSPKTRIIFGGPHPTAVYEKLIPQYADIVVLGEGEDTIVELMQQDDLSKIKGIAYYDGSLKVNERRPLIEDLDRLGFPAWHLYDLKRYRYATRRIPFAMITTSRGCPYSCIYCTKHVHGYKIRLRSLENVMKEIDYLVNKLGVKEIRFKDDNFTFYPDRVKQLCERIIAKKYRHIRFALPTGIGLNNINIEVFKLMEKAGFYQIGISIESGSQEVLGKLKSKVDFCALRKNLKLIKKIGLEINLYYMIGLPFDNVETMQDTINLAKSLPADNICFELAIPFPGTEFYEIVKAKGRFLCDLTMSSSHYEGHAVYEMGTLTGDDVNRMYRSAYRQFYLRPSQIYRIFNLEIPSFRSLLRLVNYELSILFQGGQIA
jgi:radical SAM superfamily enzyme YgiQ (UPF0313 family)